MDTQEQSGAENVKKQLLIVHKGQGYRKKDGKKALEVVVYLSRKHGKLTLSEPGKTATKKYTLSQEDTVVSFGALQDYYVQVVLKNVKTVTRKETRGEKETRNAELTVFIPSYDVEHFANALGRSVSYIAAHKILAHVWKGYPINFFSGTFDEEWFFVFKRFADTFKTVYKRGSDLFSESARELAWKRSGKEYKHHAEVEPLRYAKVRLGWQGTSALWSAVDVNTIFFLIGDMVASLDIRFREENGAQVVYSSKPQGRGVRRSDVLACLFDLLTFVAERLDYSEKATFKFLVDEVTKWFLPRPSKTWQDYDGYCNAYKKIPEYNECRLCVTKLIEDFEVMFDGVSVKQMLQDEDAHLRF